MFLASINPKSAIGRLLRFPLQLIPTRSVVPVLCGINKGFRWRVGSSIHRCWLGFYESDKQSVIGRLVKPGWTAYDIGANAGFYTLAFSRLVGPDGTVCAFEPFAENAVNVLDHLRWNGCKNAALYQLAIADQEGVTAFHVGEHNAEGRIGGQGNYWVPTTTIDALIEKCGLPAPNIVKMDVEGAEVKVLRGARKLLDMRKTIWMIALHGSDQRQECGGVMVDYGYKMFRLDGTEISSRNIDSDEIYALPDQC